MHWWPYFVSFSRSWPCFVSFFSYHYKLLPAHRKLVVKAKVVVSAAGALHTPALLLRSQICHSGMVGAHLTLHPVLGAGGVFPDVEVRKNTGSAVPRCVVFSSAAH